MGVRYHQDVTGVHRVNVHEGSAQVITVDEVGGGEAGEDITEDAGGHRKLHETVRS
jgi:hypothetical protein